MSVKDNNIRDVQCQRLVDMLHFNMPEDDLNRPIWKLLILDRVGQRILSPLLKVNDLREHGVTLFLQLNSNRETVPEVPIVYFVEANCENIARICADLRANLYESIYLNFTNYISRDSLEALAQAALESRSRTRIAQVYDQYLDYVSLEDNLFTLGREGILGKLNCEQDRELVDQLSMGIFSVLMSFGGAAPILCCPKSSSSNSLTSAVFSRLESRVRNHLLDSKMTNFSEGTFPARPLLLLVDRFVDLGSPLRHSSTYNALIDDILGLEGNRVTLKEGSDTKCLDIDRRDWFWRENSTRPFPNVAEAVEGALKAYKADYDRVLQTTPGMTEDLLKQQSADLQAANASSPLTPEQLKVAINVLPELTERKRLIDLHLQLATSLLEAIKSRDLGNLFHVEQSLSTLSPGELLNHLRDARLNGNARDKLRLFLLYFLRAPVSAGGANQQHLLKEAASALSSCGLSEKDMVVFNYVTTQLIHDPALNNSFAAATGNSNPLSPHKPASPISPISGGNISDFLSRLPNVGGGLLGGLMNSVKNLLPMVEETPLTRIIDSALGAVSCGSGGQVVRAGDQLRISDPRPQARAQSTSQLPGQAIDHVIVVMLGGLSYSEYDLLTDRFSGSRHLQALKLTLGATEMLSANKFVEQLAQRASGSELL